MKLAKYLKPYWFFALISPILMISEVSADLSLPYLMSYIVDFGIGENGLELIREKQIPFSIMNFIYGEGNYSQMNIIITFGIMMLLIVLVGGFFGTLCAYTAAKATTVVTDMNYAVC